MNAEIKRHIDSARQVLVWVVPNPTSQIDQITNALIYKFMDDMDQASIKAGGAPSFFVHDLEPYAWTRLMDARVGNQERMNLYSEALIKFSQAKQLPELFRDIFKSAFLPYRSPEILGLFLKEISFFDYTHPEDLGDAYEYLLSIMSSQGDAGQFRTPRHIIDFIVAVVNPTVNDKVLDPACGTGGFLVSSYNHILRQHDGIDDPEKKEIPLTPDQRKKLMANFEGYDIDPTMVRIAQVNMYLHQFKNPKIYQYDSLGQEERWGDKFDVVLANPPFMSPKGGVMPHSKFSISSSRSEVLFVDYIMNHLRPNGRAGIIVPEGIIFQSGAAHKQLRKNLVEDGLYAVVSLPSGVFAPYSWVKTSILLFNNVLAKKSSEILFVKIESDGFDLGAQRRVNEKNDLPIALDILNKWNTGEKVENKIALYVERIKIAENEDYNLSCDRYRIATDYSNAKWPMVELGDVAQVLKGSAITKKDTLDGSIPVIAGGQEPAYYHNESNRTGEIITVSASGAYAGFVNYFSVPIFASDCSTIQAKDKNFVSNKYLYSVLKAKQEDIYKFQQGGGQPHVYPKDLKSIQIPLPPIEFQEQIVAELNGYAGIIAGAKQIAQNWKPKIDIDPVWKIVSMGDVVDLISGQHIESEKYSEKKVGTPYITGPSDFGEINPIITKWTESPKILACRNDILVTVKGSGIGSLNILDADEVCISRQIMAIRPQNINGLFLFCFLRGKYEYFQQKGAGAAIPGLTRSDFLDLKIPLPPLETQEQIINKIEAERILVVSAKKLIEIYEQKTKETIAKLWAE